MDTDKGRVGQLLATFKKTNANSRSTNANSRSTGTFLCVRFNDMPNMLIGIKSSEARTQDLNIGDSYHLHVSIIPSASSCLINFSEEYVDIKVSRQLDSKPTPCAA